MIAVELRKLVRRPRTWVTMALLVMLPTLVAIFVKVTHVGPRPGEGPPFLSAILSNGALFPAAALALVLPLFLPVAVAVIAGDAVAGEASAGTLRYLLVRPVGRTRLLVAKLVAVAVFILLAVVIGGFATSGIVFLKMIGIGMLVAVLLDATVVRALLVPATMRLLGDANWWAPGPMRRWWERHGLREHDGAEPSPRNAQQLVGAGSRRG